MKEALPHHEKGSFAAQESACRMIETHNPLYINDLPEPRESGVFASGEYSALRCGSHDELRENNYAYAKAYPHNYTFWRAHLRTRLCRILPVSPKSRA